MQSLRFRARQAGPGGEISVAYSRSEAVMALRLTMAFSDNPRVQPLKDGAVKPQGIDLNCVTIEPGSLFFRNLLCDELDVFEMSSAVTLLTIDRRDVGRCDGSALPVFLSRGHHCPNF